MEANKTVAPRDMHGIAMIVAEAAYKAGCGRDRALPADFLRDIVNDAIGANAATTIPRDSDSDRELGEIINYAIAAYKKGMAVDKIFTVVPTDANGYMAAFIVRAIDHHAPTLSRVGAA